MGRRLRYTSQVTGRKGTKPECFVLQLHRLTWSRLYAQLRVGPSLSDTRSLYVVTNPEQQSASICSPLSSRNRPTLVMSCIRSECNDKWIERAILLQWRLMVYLRMACSISLMQIASATISLDGECRSLRVCSSILQNVLGS